MSGFNDTNERISIRRKRKKSRAEIIKQILCYSLVGVVWISAALLGIVAAKKYVQPYNPEIAKHFSYGVFEEVEISEEKCNILIMGTDKEGLRTDVLMLAQIDPDKDSVTVMSIPRDTWVPYKGRKMKITEVHAVGYNSAKGQSKAVRGAKGSEATIMAVKELTGVPINYHIKVNFKAFRQCIDELGGVDFNVPQNMYYKDPAQDLYINLKKGKQHLNGDKAEQLVRFRRYQNGDLGRIKVQQDFMHALVEQKLKAKYIGDIVDIYDIIIENMETLMSPDDFVQCGKQVLSIGTENIQTVTLPVSMVEGQPYVVPVYSEIEKVREAYFGYDDYGNNV